MNPEVIIQNAPMLLAFTIVGLLGFIGLLAIGLNMRRGETKTNPPPGATPDVNQKPAFSLPAAIAERLPGRPPAPQEPNANEVLRVLRDRLTGRVVIEINGRRYAQMSDVNEGDVRRALLLTMRDLQEFVGMSLTTVMPTPSVSPPPASVVPPPPPAPLPATPPDAPASPEVTPESAPAPTPPAAEAADSPAVPLNPAPLPKKENPSNTPLRTPSMNIFKQMSVAREVAAKEIEPIRPLAEQIDEVLQHVIAGTPFAAQNLHVASSPTGNVIFEVGTQVYDSVDAIPDRTLQVVFQEAIRRWEQQQ